MPKRKPVPIETEIDCLRAIADGIQRLALVAETILAQREAPPVPESEEPQRRPMWLGGDVPPF